MEQFNSTRVYELSDKFKALSHPQRLCIVRDLMEQASNVSGIQSQLGIPQPSVSAHLAKLKMAGIVQGQRNGQEIQYRVVDADTRQLLTALMGSTPT